MVDRIDVIEWPEDIPGSTEDVVRERYRAYRTDARFARAVYYATRLCAGMSSIFMMAFAASYPAASVYVGIATALALVGDQVWDPRRRWQRAAMAASNLALEALVTTNDARRLKRQLDIIMSTEREFFATLFAIDAMVNGLPKRNAAEIVR